MCYADNRTSRRRKVHMTVMENKKPCYDTGMIKVDGIEPTLEIKELLEKEKRGEITMEEIRDIFSSRRYRMKL